MATVKACPCISKKQMVNFLLELTDFGELSQVFGQQLYKLKGEVCA